MYRCEYCNRHLKQKYDKCPACGSTSFKKLQNYGEEVIKTPPKDGYKLNFENYKVEEKESKIGSYIGIGVIILCIAPFLPFTLIFLLILLIPSEGDSSTTLTILEMLFIPLIFICMAYCIARIFFKHTKDTKKRVNEKLVKLEELSKHGILIKNLKYRIKAVDNTVHGNKTIYKIQVLYEIEKGRTMCFESEPKYLSTLGRDDGTVDLLIDPNDYSNYFIDFEIY